MQVNHTAFVSNAEAGQETAAKFLVGTASGHGSIREAEPTSAFSNPIPATENPVDVFVHQAARLEARAAGLAQQLFEAAGQLESGGIPAERLASDLTLFQRDVKGLQQQTAELAGSLSVPSEAAMGPVETFRGLHTVLAAIREAQSCNAFRDLHVQAARELEGVLAIESRSGFEITPLDEIKVLAKRLLAEIVGAQWPDSHPDSVPLAERRHPYSRLLDLVCYSERLSDSDWETAQEEVATAFGRPLAVAAVRSRLEVKARTAPGGSPGPLPHL